MEEQGRKEGLQLAIRRNRGKQVLPVFLTNLSTTLKRPRECIALLDLETTDHVWETYRNRFHQCLDGRTACFQKQCPATKVQDVASVLAQLKNRLTNLQIFLLRIDSEFCGAVECTINEILENAFELVSLDQEELRACDKEGRCGLFFEYYTERYSSGCVEEYRVILWGDEWLEAVNN